MKFTHVFTLILWNRVVVALIPNSRYRRTNIIPRTNILEVLEMLIEVIGNLFLGHGDIKVSGFQKVKNYSARKHKGGHWYTQVEISV